MTTRRFLLLFSDQSQILFLLSSANEVSAGRASRSTPSPTSPGSRRSLKVSLMNLLIRWSMCRKSIFTLFVFFLQISPRRPSSTDVNGDTEQTEDDKTVEGLFVPNLKPIRKCCLLPGCWLLFTMCHLLTQWMETDQFPLPSSTTNTKWEKWSETETSLWWRSVWRGELERHQNLKTHANYFYI